MLDKNNQIRAKFAKGLQWIVKWNRMERKKKGVEQAGLAKHIRQMRSCRSKNNENYNKTNSFIQ